MTVASPVAARMVGNGSMWRSSASAFPTGLPVLFAQFHPALRDARSTRPLRLAAVLTGLRVCPRRDDPDVRPGDEGPSDRLRLPRAPVVPFPSGRTDSFRSGAASSSIDCSASAAVERSVNRRGGRALVAAIDVLGPVDVQG